MSQPASTTFATAKARGLLIGTAGFMLLAIGFSYDHF